MKKSLQTIRRGSHQWLLMFLIFYAGISVCSAANEELPSVGKVETSLHGTSAIADDRAWTIQGQYFRQFAG